MSQGTVTLPLTGVVSGLTIATDINSAFDAFRTMFSGSSAPSADTPEEGQMWLDTSTTPKTVKLYDGASWTVMGYLDDVNHVFISVVGGGTDTLASAGTTDLWSKTEAYLTVSGTASITQLANASAVAGTEKIVKATGAFTLTYDATKLILPGSANIVAASGDYFKVVALTSTNVAVTQYTKADGTPLPSVITTASLQAQAVTYAKIQNVSATSLILGRSTAGAGSPEECTLSTVLDFVGSAANGDILIRSGGAWTRLPKATDGNALIQASGLPSWGIASTPLYHIQDSRAKGTNGDAGSGGAWAARTLQTEPVKEISGASLAASVITLPAGTYFIDIRAATVAANSGIKRLRLRNTTDSVDVLYSQSGHAPFVAAGLSTGFGVLTLAGRVVIAGAKTFALQYWTDSADTLTASNITSVTELYTDVFIYKVA